MIDDLMDEEVPQGMTDSEICAVIDGELAQSIGYNDEVAHLRKTALEYYMGDAVGDLSPPDLDGLSRVVSKDLMDTVEWIMPSMMRLFCGSDSVARFEADSEADEKACDDATRFANHIIQERNEGFRLLHDAIKNALIQRMGIVKVYYCKDEDVRQETYQGISELDVQALTQDKTIQIVNVEQIDEQFYNVTVSSVGPQQPYKLEGVPPEEFRMNRDAKSIETARFVAHEVKKSRSDLVTMGLTDDEIKALSMGDDWGDQNGEEVTRSTVLSQYGAETEAVEKSQSEYLLTEAWLRIDADGDGVSEYRRVLKSGTVVLENEITDDHPFAMFCPILMPYQAVGLGVYDLIKDIQDIKTALSRNMLDNAYMANNSRSLVVEGQVNLDDLLNNVSNGVIRAQSLDSMREITTPFLGTAGMAMLDHFDKIRDGRTGVTEFNQGLGGSELQNTNIGSQGMQSMMNSAMQRVELIARVLAETGFKRLYRLVLKMVTQNHDRPAELKVNGRFIQIDPREWKNQYRLSISVGMAAISREAQVVNMQTVMSLQERGAQFGLATPKNAYNALSRMIENMGYRDASQFFTAPDENPQPQGPPEPDPKDVMDMQFKQAQLQMQTQLKQMDIDAQNRRNQQDNEVKVMLEREKIESAERIAYERIKADLLTKQPFDGAIGYNPQAANQVGQ